MKPIRFALGVALINFLGSSGSLLGQGTAFTYQGRLSAGGVPANGLYEIGFNLHDAATNGNVIGTPVTVAPVPVTNGLFTATLDFGASVFTGPDRWLEISVTLFGSDQPVVTLQPRQPITPTPYALHAANAANLMSFGNAPLDIKVNGLRALRLEPYAVSPNLVGGFSGNMVSNGVVGGTISGGGTDGGENQIGGDFATIGGGIGNAANGFEATIGGGAFGVASLDYATVGGGYYNNATGFSATVGGGENNTASGSGATISGGGGNTASNRATVGGGSANTASGELATVGGGENNSASGWYSTIGGGAANASSGQYATVSGGNANASTGLYATVSGGADNIASNYAAITGGVGNTAFGDYASIGGGQVNLAHGDYATIAGGQFNIIGVEFEDGGMPDANYAVIGGGLENIANGFGSTIAGGTKNLATTAAAAIAGGSYNRASGYGASVSGGQENTNGGAFSTIGGGERNEIQTQEANHTVIGGGQGNRIFSASGAFIGGGIRNMIWSNSFESVIGGGGAHFIDAGAYSSTISGGSENEIRTQASSSTIAGGSENEISARARFSTIGGGNQNSVRSNAWYATIAGGSDNNVGPGTYYATVPGGRGNWAWASYSFAAGRQAKAVHEGSFVWADAGMGLSGDSADFLSTATNEFSVRATGGIRFVSAIDTKGSNIAGVTLAPGSGTWSSLSDRTAKENFTAANPREVLEKVSVLPLASWNYKAQDKSIRHLGPMAQDFRAAFGLGESDRTITTVDADGVALAAIQGLNQKLADELKRRDAENAALKTRLEKLERLFSAPEQASIAK